MESIQELRREKKQEFTSESENLNNISLKEGENYSDVMCRKLAQSRQNTHLRYENNEGIKRRKLEEKDKLSVQELLPSSIQETRLPISFQYSNTSELYMIPSWNSNHCDRLLQPLTPRGGSSGINPFSANMLTENKNDVIGMGNYCQYDRSAIEHSINPPIQLTKSVLYSPNPNIPHPKIHKKPFGCKTVFVAGLPVKATEEVIEEIFGRCGTVENIRMSERNFCHVRFVDESSVESAVNFSGYLIKIDNRNEPPYTGKILVDYVKSGEEYNENEHKQRFLPSQAHRQDQDYRSFQSTRYSNKEARILAEKLRNEDTFSEALNMLIIWLCKGECTKQNASTFYSLIQSAVSRAQHLFKKKVCSEENFNKMKYNILQCMDEKCALSNNIEEVFNSSQKEWNHFTSTQRKNIELWQKHFKEWRAKCIRDGLFYENDFQFGKVVKLRKENINLITQLKALEEKKNKLLSENEKEIKLKETELQALKCDVLDLNKNIMNLRKRTSVVKRENSACEGGLDTAVNPTSNGCTSSSLTQKEAHLIAILSKFLNVHPLGASFDQITSYLVALDFDIDVAEVENILHRFPSVFKECTNNAESTFIKKWIFCGLHS